MGYMGGSVFHKDKNKANVPLSKVKSKNTDRLSRIVFGKQLLITEKRTQVQKDFFALMGFDTEHYDKLCQSLLINMANYLQDLPETRNSYFSNRGGFLNHGLSRCAAALGAARAYFVNDEGKPSPELSAEQQLWMYALFSAALLKGIGKLFVDFIVEMFDSNGEFIGNWHVFEGSMKEQGAFFFDYDFDVPYQEIFRHRVTLILARQIMPPEGYNWLASDKNVFAIWLALLEDDNRSGGTLGMILDKAEIIAINRFLNERALAAYNQDGDAKPFSKKGTTFGVPQQHITDIGKEGNIPQAGMEFVKWLNRSLLTARLMINQAPLFSVPGGLLMSPDIFKLFIREHPQFKNADTVQAAFTQMQLHSTGPNGEAKQSFIQNKTKQIHSGVVLSAVGLVLPEKVKMVNLSNGAIKQVNSSTLSLNKMSSSDFSTASKSAGPIQTLSSSGEWQTPKAGSPSPQNPTQKG